MSEGQGTATKSGAPDPLIGRVIADRFKIVSLIARGGMGKVYRAEQAPLGRICAIKVLNPNYNGDADPEFHRRFFREASITSKITHPNSVTIFDYGKTEDDIYFMAMEYLEGQTLHMALRDRGVFSEYRVGRITSQICRALREAHKLGVIHRDLKPANIFLTRANRASNADASDSMPPVSEEDEDFVKVLDFGLVKHLSERPEEQLTQTGLFMGSPKYMAPEQIQGGNVDERTDIYSLGIMMYEMLAGKVPFERATSVNILMAHVGEPPPPMRAVNPNLVCSPAFEELVMACIAKDPNHRIGSMDMLIQAIRRVHGGSMTGQLPAVNISGPYAQLASASAQFPSVLASASGPAVAVSGSHEIPYGSMAPVYDPRLVLTGSIPASKPTSKLWIALGVIAAAAIGGGLGLLAFRYSSGSAARAQPRVVQSASAAPTTPATSATTTATAVTPPAPTVSAAPTLTTLTSVTITTDPPGASVREDGKELCPATPCDLAFADTSKAHKLLVLRAGYRMEARTVRVGDAPLHLKLTHLTSGARPAPAPTTPASPDGPTPSGFKDQPY